MKDILGQECVKGEILSFQGKIGTIAHDFPGKNDSYLVLVLLFHLFLPKIWSAHLYKNYIFGMSNNMAIR